MSPNGSPAGVETFTTDEWASEEITSRTQERKQVVIGVDNSQPAWTKTEAVGRCAGCEWSCFSSMMCSRCADGVSAIEILEEKMLEQLLHNQLASSCTLFHSLSRPSRVLRFSSDVPRQCLKCEYVVAALSVSCVPSMLGRVLPTADRWHNSMLADHSATRGTSCFSQVWFALRRREWWSMQAVPRARVSVRRVYILGRRKDLPREALL